MFNRFCLRAMFWAGLCGTTLCSAISNAQVLAADPPDEAPLALWVDQKHARIEQLLQTQANTMDAWFGTGATRAPRAKIKILLDQAWDEQQGLDANIRIRGSLRLPNASKRFRLMFGDDTVDDEQAAGRTILPRTPINTRPAPEDTSSVSRDPKARPTLHDVNAQALKDNASIAIRLLAPLGPHVKSDLDVGVRAGTDVYVRGEIGKQWTLNDDNKMLLNQTVRLGAKSMWYARTDFEVQHVPDQQPSLFYHTSMAYADDERDLGWRWAHRVSRQHIVQKQAVWSYGLQANERLQDQHFLLDSYGPWMSWEQPLWRDWIRLRSDLNYFNDRKKDLAHHPSVFMRLQAQF